MNLREFSDILKQRVEAMNANRERDALIIASDLKALVQLRIQTTGTAYTGSQFSPYSEGYKKKRAKGGLQTGIVDYTVTGQLWRNIRAEVTGSAANSVTVEITARDELNQAKLRGATVQPKSRPRGNPLIPNEEEIKIVQEANKNRVIKYLTA